MIGRHRGLGGWLRRYVCMDLVLKVEPDGLLCTGNRRKLGRRVRNPGAGREEERCRQQAPP